MITIKKAIEYLQDQIKIIDEVEEVELKDEMCIRDST